MILVTGICFTVHVEYNALNSFVLNTFDFLTQCLIFVASYQPLVV